MIHQLVPLDDGETVFLSGLIFDWHPLRERGITVVMDLEGEVDHGVPSVADELLYIYLPIHDAHLPQLDRLHAVARLGATLVGGGHRVLSHCGLGLNRSALMAGMILRYLGMGGEAAVERIRERRPGALFNGAFADYLRTANLRREDRWHEPHAE